MSTPAIPRSGEIVAGANEIRQKVQENIESKRGHRRKFGLFGGKKKKDDADEQHDLRAEIAMDEHKISLEDLCARFDTNVETGLTNEQAKQKQQEQGLNRLTPPATTPWWVLLLATQTGFFSLLLWFGAILCFVGYGLKKEQENLALGLVLAFVVILTGVFSFFQERKSSNLMDSFKNMMPTKTTVIRNGEPSEIDAINLVAGDVVRLKPGDKVPADLRVVECSDDMKVDNASLTGEAEPIKREPKCTDENPMETNNLCFFGTLVPTGTATCMVVQIGDNTLMGRIARLSLTTTNVETPIAKEIEHFVKIVSAVAITLGITFFIIGAALGTEWLTNLVFMIGIIVANVPEGLLATVTVCLTLTAKRMHSKSVLVKNLEGVETLGSTSCICSDKTGTLTQNIMTVAHLVYDLQIWDVESTMAQQNFNEADPSFKSILRCATLCNTAVWDKNSQVVDGREINFMEDVTLGDGSVERKIMWKPIGDASESAMIKFAQTKRDIMEYREKCPLNPRGKIPFNSANKFQVHVNWDDEAGQYVDLLKGAPERVTARCKTILMNGEEIPLTNEHLKQIDNLQLQLSRRGMRVLGFAEKRLDPTDYPKTYEFDSDQVNFPIGETEEAYNQRCALVGEADKPSPRSMEPLCYIGMMALIDPPRPQVPPAVSKCKTAGIKVIMVTGDHPETAKAISKKVGIIWSETGDDIQHHNEDNNLKEGDAGWEDPDLAQAIVVPGWDISVDTPEHVWDDILAHSQVVFARTSPQQKLIIVENCQRRRHVVAVTGDGVNDSPALKKADIGVAMGIMGTDVSKEAADMILLDDNFASIVSGVEEGRLIFDNLKKSIAYTLSSNIPEIAPFLSFIMVQIPLPLSTILILCVDLGTDMIPAISMAWENPEADIMARNPRDADVDRLVTKKLVSFAYLQIGVIQSVSGFYTYLTVLNDYGYSAWLLPGLGAVDAWGKMTLLCNVENGGWRNYGGDICPCYVDPTGAGKAFCGDLAGINWWESTYANDMYVTRCQQIGYKYYDPDVTLQYVDEQGRGQMSPTGVVHTCAYPMRQIGQITSVSEPGNFAMFDPATYFENGELYTGAIVLPTKQSHDALRGGAACAEATTPCTYYYEYSPYRGVESSYFNRQWGSWNMWDNSIVGSGDTILPTVLLSFQPLGFWNTHESTVVTGRAPNAGHVSNVVDVTSSATNPFRLDKLTYFSGYLDQSTQIDTVQYFSTNSLPNSFWNDLPLTYDTAEELEKGQFYLQAQRCENKCWSQPGFVELAWEVYNNRANGQSLPSPGCSTSELDDFMAQFQSGTVSCYNTNDYPADALVVDVTSRQFSKEALHHAQTASFIGIIIVQWADLVICKTRWLSIRQQGMKNSVMNFALVFELLLGSFLCYILPIGAIGTRPLRITHWFPAMPFSIVIFTYDELRKYFMRETSDVEINKLTGRTVRHPGWLERNTYY